MKFKDYFSKLKEQGKIKNEVYDKFLETVPDGDMPDEVFPIIDSTFLTVDRALTHKDVAGKIKAEVLDIVDKEIQKNLKLLPAERVLEIERETSTFKKLGILSDAIPEALSKAAKAPNDEESKKKLQESQSVIQELTEKFNKLNTSHQEEIKKEQSKYVSELKNYKLDAELEKIANSYTFADVFKDARPTLTKAILGDLKAKNKLDLIEKDGSYNIAIFDEHGAPRFENNGNTPVTINSLLEPTLKPYLKVSDDSQQQQQAPQARSFKVDDGGAQGSRRGANVTAQV